MAKSPVIVHGVSVEQKQEIEFAAKEERRDIAVCAREAWTEWMAKRGYQWTDNFKSLKRPSGRFPSLAAQARAVGVSRQTTRYHANKKNKVAK